jgi:hypothetical protein
VYNCPCVAYVFTIPCTNCLTFTATSPKQTECRTDSQDYGADEILYSIKKRLFHKRSQFASEIFALFRVSPQAYISLHAADYTKSCNLLDP